MLSTFPHDVEITVITYVEIKLKKNVYPQNLLVEKPKNLTIFSD